MSQVQESYGFPLAVGVHTDTGRVRTNNEDNHGTAWLGDGSLFVMVADGMGGHEAGEVASGLAVQVVEEVVGRDPNADPRERLYNALLEANSTILEEGRRTGKQGMGTTSVCAVVRGNEATIALVGDSRCYHVRNGHLVWRTIDHTRVQMLIDTGEIDEEQARVHPEAGMLTRALGHQRMADGRPLVPDVLSEPIRLEEGDALVFCSDGLHDLVEDWEIGRVVAGRNPQEAAEALVELACDRGGHDNVTVAVIIAGEQATQYDPNFQAPPKPDAEPTYPGYDDRTPVQDTPVARPMPPAPASTGVFSPNAVKEALNQSRQQMQHDDDEPAPAARRGGSAPPAAAGGTNTMIYVVVGVVLLVVVGGVGLTVLSVLGIVGYSLSR